MKATSYAVVLVTLFSSIQLMAASPIKKAARFELSTQGMCIQLQVTPDQRAKTIVNGREQGSYVVSNSYLDGRPRVMVTLDQDDLPALRPDQQTYYDSRLDHHSITELMVVLDASGSKVEEIEYHRYQDIDYGYSSESSVLSPLVKAHCSQ